ncbi:hypothetical protein DRN89_00095 [archaeon]|nr:MAG: hypothetical protein DRN89_00095 [archaeon]
MKVLKILKGLLKGELFVDRIKAKEAEVQKLKAGKHTVDIENTYIHISGATPYVRFEGTETGAADKGIKEDSGTLKIYDFSAASNVMDIEAHASRHAHGGADALADNALRFSQIDKVFGTESTVTVTAGSTSTISKGVFLVSLGANTKVEYSPDGGTTWRLLIPAGEGGVVISDGSNVRLNNTGTSDETSYLLPVQ